MRRQFYAITGTSPAAASTAILANSVIGGLQEYDWFSVDAALVGATGGTLDVYIQRQVAQSAEVAGGVWADWLHFPQLAAGAAAIKYSAQAGSGVSIVVVGNGTDASGAGPALAVNTFLGGHPGLAIRVVCVAGASTSAGAAVAIYLTARKGAGGGA